MTCHVSFAGTRRTMGAEARMMNLNTQSDITRRAAFPSIGAGLLLAGGTSTSIASEPSPVAETAYGRVRGGTVRGVHMFRGIPYGGPTEGSGRFLPPTKPATWGGVRDAMVTGPRCVQ